MLDLEYQVSDLERKISTSLMYGRIKEVSEDLRFVRVSVFVEDNKTIPTPFIPMITDYREGDIYHKPLRSGLREDEKGELVAVFNPTGDFKSGIVLGTVADLDSLPSSNKETPHIKFKDGTEIKYNKADKELSVKVVDGGKVDISVGEGGKISFGVGSEDVFSLLKEFMEVFSKASKISVPSPNGASGEIFPDVKEAVVTLVTRLDKLIGS